MSSIAVLRTLTVTDVVDIPTPPAPWYGYGHAAADAQNSYGDDWILSGYQGPRNREANTLILWRAGCAVDGGLNCKIACYDEVRGPEMVWDSSDGMWTLQNCLVYPLLAAAAGTGLLVEDPPGTLERYGIISNASWAAAIMNGSTATDLWPVITNCMQQYCNATTIVCGLRWGRFYYDSWHNISSDTGPVCPDISVRYAGGEENQDIQGPGVSASVFVQGIILSVAWLFIDLNAGWLQKFGQSIRLIPKEGTGWRVFRFPTQQAAMFTALIDFQKTQVFFAMTLFVALFMAYRNNALLEPSSWGQLQSSFEFFQYLVSWGTAPVTLNLMTLRKDTKELEWYILGISAMCIFVAVAAVGIAATIVPSTTQRPDPKVQLHVCGGFSPVYTAYPPPGVQPSNSIIYESLLPVSLLALTYILLDKLSRSPFLEKKLSLRRRLRSLRQTIPTWLYIAIYVVIGLCEFAAEMTLLAWSIISSILVTRDDRKWTLGQIITVAIWFPIFVNWVYTALTGVEKALQHVLSHDYRVVRKSTQELAAEFDDGRRGSEDGDVAALIHTSSASAHQMHVPRDDPATPRYRSLHSSTF